MAEETTRLYMEPAMEASTGKPGLTFYTTAGCHLCEEAERLLIELVAQHAVAVEVVDIAEDERLAEVYGIRIPVVRHEETGREAGWPFSYGELVGLLGEG